jgi:two-component system sensor histidine kinase UhpB
LKKHTLILLFIGLPILLFAQRNKIDSLINIVNKHTHDSTEVKALYILGFETAKKDPPRALGYCREAIHISEKYAPGPWEGSAYLQIATLRGSLGQHDSVLFYLDKAEQILKAYPENMTLRYDFYTISGIFNKNTGKYEKALNFFKLITLVNDGILKKENIAGNYLNISNVYHSMGKHSLSQDYLFKALTIFEAIKSETGIAFCYNGLGNEFYRQKNYGKAKEYLKKSLALKEKSGNKKAMATGLNGLANLYMDLEEYSEALKNINRAITLCEELGLKDHLCECNINKGMICFRQGNKKEALECFLKGKAIAEELHNNNYLAHINTELGRLYQQQSENEKALASLLQGIEQAKQVKSLSAEEKAHHLLAEFYYRNNHYKEAYDEYVIFHALYDTASGSTIKIKLYDFEAKYETEKKENQIKLLQKDQQLQVIALREKSIFQTAILITLGLVVVIGILFFNWYRVVSRTRRQLEIERMRNHIARDLHDDIGSTLSSINIISKMASQNPSNKNTNSNFAQIEDYSGKMLSTMADIVWSINPGNDTLDEIILHMKEFAAEILEPKNINYHFEEIGSIKNLKIDATIRKNLFLIFKEALNNAMKYSQCTEIRIRLALASTRLTLEINDNGDGFNFKEIKPGNGLNNMRDRAVLMNGQLEIKTAPYQGTHISISTIIA